MEPGKIFGDSAVFAIEINRISKIACLRLWINGQSYGDYKKKDELLDSVEDLRRLLEDLDSLHDKIFDPISPDKILSWILLMRTQEDYEKRRKYIRFMGEQMDNISMFSYLKDGKLEWAFKKVKSKKITTQQIEKDILIQVCKDYLNWYSTL